jgi:hypothetical protein
MIGISKHVHSSLAGIMPPSWREKWLERNEPNQSPSPKKWAKKQKKTSGNFVKKAGGRPPDQ